MPADKNAKQTLTMDHLRKGKKPSQKTIYLPRDDELAEEFEELTDRLSSMQQSVAIMPKSEELRQDLEELEQEYNEMLARVRDPENSFKFVFQSLGPTKYEDLQDECPVTDKQKADLEEKGLDPNVLSYDAEAFAPKLVAACCVSPELSEEFVRDEIQNCSDGSWSLGEFRQMYQAAVDVNVRARSLTLGKEFKKTKRSGKS